MERTIHGQEVVYIDGYWLDTKETFSNYKCVIGEWNELEDEEDESIFYYFEDRNELKSFQKVKGRTDTEFVITEIRRD